MSEPGVVVGRAEVVLALAGHVDHGKSALAGALTGSRTDRRQAEQARGLTVDLGHLVLHGPRPVAVTDVPGHVDYLGNTVVGLAGATHALLVVAADDGWMPQTEDHVRAATHLDVPIPVVAVSKTDLVDESRVDAVADDVRRRLAAVGDSPTVVPVSATAGYGLDELRDALAELSVSPAPDGAPRLWVDRAFRVEGRGLVVAGTLAAGALVVGDRVTVAPYGRTGRVRGLQCHGRSVDRATAPARVAVDLADVAADRGDRLVAGALGRQVPATTRVDAWVHSQHVPGIGDRGAWVLHVGSTHVEVEVAPLGRQPLVAGEDGPVALRLARPVPLVHGDRLVLRDAGRRVVAGGGVVLDPAPPPRPRGRRAREGRARSLATLRIAPDPAAALADADGGVVPATRIIVALADPTAGGNAVSGHVVTDAARDRLATAARDVLDGAGPAGRAVDEVVAGVASATHVPGTVVRAVLADLDGVVRRDTRMVLAARGADLDADRQRALARLHAALRAAPLAPAPLDDLVAEAQVPGADLDRLVRHRQVLRSGPYGFLPAAVDLVLARLRELEERAGAFTVAEARDALGITRKHAVPWMELLDRLGATTREGDRRRITPAGSSRPAPTPGDR